MATGSFEGELEKDYGKEVKAEIGPTTPFSLKGIQFAAKKYATYTLQGVKREQGWIYGFTEPYQMFILYMILEKEGANDRQDMAKILESFEFIIEIIKKIERRRRQWQRKRNQEFISVRVAEWLPQRKATSVIRRRSNGPIRVSIAVLPLPIRGMCANPRSQN